MLQYTLVSGGVTTKYAYFITTWQSNANVSYATWSGWSLEYLKCKFYSGLSLTGYFFFGDGTIEAATQTFTTSYCSWPLSVSPVSMYFTQNYFVSDGTDTSLVHEIDFSPPMRAITNFGFRSGDSMVLSITYAANPWATLLSCDILGGIISTSVNQRAYCNVRNNNNIYISNVGGFLTDPLLSITNNYRIKVRMVSSGLSTTTNDNNFNFCTLLYANYDAYINGYHPIIN